MSSDDDDDEDNTAELLATLQKIRKERAEEKERQERERLAAEEAKREQEALTGNPLLQLGEQKRDFSVKRRYVLGTCASCEKARFSSLF